MNEIVDYRCENCGKVFLRGPPDLKGKLPGMKKKCRCSQCAGSSRTHRYKTVYARSDDAVGDSNPAEQTALRKMEDA